MVGFLTQKFFKKLTNFMRIIDLEMIYIYHLYVMSIGNHLLFYKINDIFIAWSISGARSNHDEIIFLIDS